MCVPKTPVYIHIIFHKLQSNNQETTQSASVTGILKLYAICIKKKYNMDTSSSSFMLLHTTFKYANFKHMLI